MKSAKNKISKQTIFNILTVVNFLAIVAIYAFFWLIIFPGEINNAISTAKHSLNTDQKIECLRDEIKGIKPDESISCLYTKKFPHISQCELRNNNPHVETWQKELKKDCDIIDEVDEKIKQLQDKVNAEQK